MQFIPEISPESPFCIYQPSPAALLLESERKHAFRLEILKWNRTQPDELNLMCLLPVIKAAHGDPEHLRIPLVNCAEVHAYLPTDLPLPQIIHIIPDGYYWKRSTVTHWTDRIHDITQYQASWKRLYAEKHLQNYIENYDFKNPPSSVLDESQNAPSDDLDNSQKQHPSGALDNSQNPTLNTSELPTEDLGNLHKSASEILADVLLLYKPYVRKLVITDMIPNIPEGEEIKKDQPYDHLKLDVFITTMEKLEELALLYKYNAKYSKLYLYLSCNDCAAIGQGLASTDHVLILRLHHIFLRTAVLEIFFNAVTNIANSISLQILDFSSCQINSHGAIALSKFLHYLPNLKELILHDNDIGPSGGSALGEVLLELKLSLKKLNMSRNPLGDSAVCDIICPMVPSTSVEELDFSDCMLTGSSIWMFRSFLVLNRTLKSLLIRNNSFGKKIGKLLLKGLIPNTCIEQLDVSNCRAAAEIETLTSILMQVNHFEACSF